LKLIAAEHFFPWIILQLERGNDGTCDGNAQEIFDFNPRTSIDREKQLAIARKCGESVPNEKRSFTQNRRLAAEAGRRGGQSVNPSKRSFSRNHALATEAGRKGGHASHPGPNKAGDQE
jgi:general stress protein YciG